MHYRLALALRDIQRLCHFSPGSEAHKRNSLGNDGTIKENGNTNPASIMEKRGEIASPMVAVLFGFDCINLLSIFIQKRAVCEAYLLVHGDLWMPTAGSCFLCSASHLI